MVYIPDYTFGDPNDYLVQPIQEIIKYLLDNLSINTYLKNRTIEGKSYPTKFYDYDNIYSLQKIIGKYTTPVCCIFPFGLTREQDMETVEDKITPTILIDTAIAASTYRISCLESTAFVEHLSTAIKFLKNWKRMEITIAEQAILNPFMNNDSKNEVAWRTKLKVKYI